MKIKNKTKQIIIAFIFCVCYLFSFSQSFDVEQSDLADGDIGKLVLITKNGSFVFQNLDFVGKKIYISVYDNKKKAVYANKEIKFSKFTYKDFPIYAINDEVKSNAWYEKNGSLFFSFGSRKISYLVELAMNNGVVISEAKEEVNIVFSKKFYDNLSKNYLIIDTTMGKLFPDHDNYFNYIKNELRIISYDGKTIQKVVFDNINNKYQHAKIMDCFYDKEDIYIVSILVSGEYDKSLFQFRNDWSVERCKKVQGVVYLSKYNVVTKSLSHSQLKQFDKGIYNRNIKIFNNSVGNSLLIMTVFDIDCGNIYLDQLARNTTFQNVNKSDISKIEKVILPTNALYQYFKDQNKFKFDGGRLLNYNVDKNGNIFTTLIKSDGNFFFPGIIGVSYFDMKGKEIYAFGYRFKSDYVSSNFFINSIKIGNATNSNIIFLNNLTDNFDLAPGVKPNRIHNDQLTAMAIEIDNQGKSLQYYVFGKPSAKDKYKRVEFSESYYDKTSNTIIAKMYDGSESKTRAVWIKLK